MRSIRSGIVLMIVFFMAAPLALAQSDADRASMQMAIDDASRAVAAAESVGAPIYAKDLYDEALTRLNAAKQTMSDSKRSVRDRARLFAVEARHAARAAESKARWIVNTTEARNLREDLIRFGTTVQPMTFAEDVMDTSRGATSTDRANFAQTWVDRATAAGGNLVAPDDLKNAQAWIKSAKRIARSDKQNESADHLSYNAEMLARRAYYLALRSEVDRMLPSLRLERTRLSQAATERAANEERARRQLAERERDALRAQLEDREQILRLQLEADRTARLEAEQRLYDLVARYEGALARADQVEVENLRRQVEDSRLQLESLQERQRLSEQTMSAETQRLQQELDRARLSGDASAQMLAEREAELRRRQEEMTRLQQEREASVLRSQETERRLNEVTQRAQQAEAESERLRALMQEAEERARQAQQQSQLVQLELERVRAERDRLERIRGLESAGAIVRTETRGIVVTLPGGIFFDSGRATLKPGARNILTKAAENLRDMPDARISIEGHTDNVGSDEMNLGLSQKRAEAVRELLINNGVEASRITATGLGEAIPIAGNNTEAGRQQNRRVEIIISQ